MTLTESFVSMLKILYNNILILQYMIPYSTLVDQSKLQQIHSLLQHALQSQDSASQKEVYNHLSSAEENPQFYLGLLAIASDTSVAINIRKMALITLKSSLKRNQDTVQFSEAQIKFIRTQIVNLRYQVSEGLANPHKNLVSMMALWGKQIDFEIMAYLITQIANEDIQKSLWSLQTLKVILQDLRFESENINCFQKPQFGQLLQQYIKIFSSKISLGHTNTTKILLECMNLLIRHSVSLQNSSQIIFEYLSVFLTPILNSNLDSSIISIALDGIMQVLQVSSKSIFHNQQVCNAIFGLQIYENSQSENKDKMQLTKKWLSLVFDLLDKDDQGGVRIKPYFAIILPKVVANLQFTKEDEINVKMEMEQQNNPYQYQDEQEEEQIKQHRGFLNYTRRKLSVFILNELFTLYCEDLWPLVHPLLQNLLKHQNPVQKEIGILMVGIIYSLMEDHLQFLEKAIPEIVSKISDKNMSDILRCTSLWAIGKMVYLIVREEDLSNQIQRQLINCLTSSQGQVKDAAYSTLDEFIRVNGSVPPNLNQIALIVIQGIRICQAKPLYNVLKICSTLYQKHSEGIPNQVTQAVLKELCGKWAKNSTSESIMSPILECLVTISSANQNVFKKYAKQIFNQTFSILQNEHQKAITLRSIDLISSMVMMQLAQINEILKQNEQFHKKIYSLIMSDENEIRNFTYGLLGDITKVTQFPKYAQAYIQTIGNNFNQNSLTSCSNALTCLTDIIVTHPFLALNYSSSIMQMASKKMKINNLQNTYGFNFARIYGRLGSLNPVEGAQILGQTLPNVCRFLKAHEHHKLTDQAYKGIFKLIEHNPNAASNCFQYLVEAFLCYPCQDKQAYSTFLTLLKSFRSSLSAENWNAFLNKPIFLPAVAKKIELISMS